MPAVEHAAVQIVALTQERVFPTAQALAEAFSTEPLKGFFLSRSIPRRWFVIVLARIFRARLTVGKPAYVAVAGGEVVGAVVIAPPRRSRGGRAGRWKIVLLGVRPGWRGRGVGSSLMDRAHALCDRDPRAGCTCPRMAAGIAPSTSDSGTGSPVKSDYGGLSSTEWFAPLLDRVGTAAV